jgi:hypothetical protein
MKNCLGVVGGCGSTAIASKMVMFNQCEFWEVWGKALELYTDSVFSVGIRSVFLGIYHTDTEGKFGRYISVSKRGQCPPFSSKGGQWPPF